MAYETKNFEGALFRNDKRQKDGDAHATGSAVIDGVEYWVNAWTNDGTKGKWQKLMFKPKQPRSEHKIQAREELNDDVPF